MSKRERIKKERRERRAMIMKEVRHRTKAVRKRVSTATKGMTESLKDLWQKYGIIAVSTYFGMYFVTLGGIFTLFDQGILGHGTFGIDIHEMVDSLCSRLEEWKYLNFLSPILKSNPKLATFAAAWLTTKITEPARAILTIAITPRFAKYLRSKGWVKGKND